MLSLYRCESHMCSQMERKQTTLALAFKSRRRHRSRSKITSSNIEHLEPTHVITGQTKREVKYDDSNVTPPFGYMSLPSDPKSSEPHSAIAESRTTSFSAEREVYMCVIKNLKENFA